MNYEAAIKQVRAAKKPDSYMTIRLFYGDRILVPQKVGMALLDALACAEHMPGHFYKSDVPRIKQIDSENIKVELFSQEEYENIKVAQLLSVTVDDLIQSKKEAQPS